MAAVALSRDIASASPWVRTLPIITERAQGSRRQSDGSGRLERGEEAGDFGVQRFRLLGELLRRRQHVMRGGAGVAGGAGDAFDIGGDLAGTLRRLLHVARDLA